jgi:hypothetical protein
MSHCGVDSALTQWQQSRMAKLAAALPLVQPAELPLVSVLCAKQTTTNTQLIV